MTNIVYGDLTSLEKTLEIKPVGSNLYHCSVLFKKKRNKQFDPGLGILIPQLSQAIWHFP